MTPEQAANAIAQQPGMNAGQAQEFLQLLMSGTLAPEEGGSLLRQLAERGETAVELAAFVRGLASQAIRIPFAGACADCCGTGGSGRTRFNVSTTAAVVVACAGIPVAKHGNKGSRRPNGSFDLLEQLGVPLQQSVDAHLELLNSYNLTFCFARAHHPAVGAVVPYRQAAGGRTIFNLAGPLANPAGANCQVVGVCDPRTAQVVAEALAELGHDHALVVSGYPGWDEFVLDGVNELWEVRSQGVRHRVMPAPWPQSADLIIPGGDHDENARLFAELLQGTHSGPLFELLCLAAGAVMDVWADRPFSPDGEGVVQARELLRSGQAWQHFTRFRQRAQELAGKNSS